MSVMCPLIRDIQNFTLPSDAMRCGKSYEFIAGDRDTEHLELRCGVVKRVKDILNENGGFSKVYTPETILNEAHDLANFYDDSDSFRDFIVIDGSDRANINTCIVIAPWTGKAYELARGDTLEAGFREFVKKMVAEMPEEDAANEERETEIFRVCVYGTCVKFLFRVGGCDALELSPSAHDDEGGKESKNSGKSRRKARNAKRR